MQIEVQSQPQTRISIIGLPPSAVDSSIDGAPRVGTLSVSHKVLITTLPAIHAFQRNELVQRLNDARSDTWQPCLTQSEEMEIHSHCVSLFFDKDFILIRPAENAIDLALQADELLQTLVPKYKIRFLHARHPEVRSTLRKRGELWRISEPPQNPKQIGDFIQQCTVSIDGNAIYRINPNTGSRWLTLQQLMELKKLEPESFRKHLIEIQMNIGRYNRAGYRELCLFPSDPPSIPLLEGLNLPAMSDTELSELHESMVKAMSDHVPPELKLEDSRNEKWRNEMSKALTEDPHGFALCDVVDGLCEAFRRQIQWLPGCSFHEDETIFDPIFELETDPVQGVSVGRICDPAVKQFILNFLREYGTLEHVNMGRLQPSPVAMPVGRRAVYIAEIQPKDAKAPILRVLRMHRWGIREHLNEGDDLMNAILQAHEYTHYVLDRRLACRHLGMNVPFRVSCWDIPETYKYPNGKEVEIWATYYERDYLPGTPANKIPEHKLYNSAYALRLATLLGKAAAPNLIVGRAEDKTTRVLFDQGDELVIEDETGLPCEFVIADLSGAFGNYENPLDTMAPAYSKAVLDRKPFLPLPRDFAKQYCDSFLERFREIRDDYLHRKAAFRRIFENQKVNAEGNFRYRWLRVLDRLENSDPVTITEIIRSKLY